MFNSFILKDLETAEASFRKVHNIPVRHRTFPYNYVDNYFCILVQGLVGFWLGKEKRNKSYRKCAVQTIQWFKERPNLNTVPLRLLLEAQEASTGRNIDAAKVKGCFDSVIVMLARSGLVHYGAIANELLAEFLMQEPQNDPGSAQIYLRRSVQLYKEWGATVKVEAITKLHGLSADVVNGNKTATTLRGRERFSSRMDSASKSKIPELVHDTSRESS